MDLTPEELVHWMHKEIQTNKKKAKYSIPQLLLSVIAKLKVKENAGLDLDARPNSDFSGSELWTVPAKPPNKEKIIQGQQKVLLRPLMTRR